MSALCNDASLLNEISANRLDFSSSKFFYQVIASLLSIMQTNKLRNKYIINILVTVHKILPVTPSVIIKINESNMTNESILAGQIIYSINTGQIINFHFAGSH